MGRRNTETNLFHVLLRGERLEAASRLAARTTVLCLRFHDELSWDARLKAASNLPAKTMVLCSGYLEPQTTYETC